MHLSHNPLGCVGGSFLSQCLKTSTTLRTLVLNHCALGMPLSTNDGDRQGRDTAAVVQSPHDATGLYELIAALGYVTMVDNGGQWCGMSGTSVY